MSGSTPMPNEHPDHDLLADLAAEVLPDDLAVRVQTHVIECASCAELLAEAEGIRSLLRQLTPEPMPEAVLSRLERALVTARQQDGLESTPVDAQPLSTPMGARPAATGSLPTGSINSGRRIARSRPSSVPSTGPNTGLISAVGSEKGAASRLSRMSRPAQRARRQALEEQRADRPSLLSRFGPVLKVAAAVLVLAGAGTLSLQFIHGSSSGQGDATSAASAGGAEVNGAPVLAPVQSTNTNYAKASLKTQVNSLISSSNQLTATDRSSAKSSPDSTAAAPRAAAQPSVGAASAGAGAGAASPQGQQLLRSPTALQACLNAIGANQPPVAVDLARYNGQEAAIIVLPADGGGYEVWVVARDCKPGDDGSIAVVTLKQ